MTGALGLAELLYKGLKMQINIGFHRKPPQSIFCCRMKHILIPIALFVSFSRQGLGTRNEGLWGHGIFELIRIFLIGRLKQRNLERK